MAGKLLITVAREADQSDVLLLLNSGQEMVRGAAAMSVVREIGADGGLNVVERRSDGGKGKDP